MIQQKTTQNAIAAMSRLAELYAEPERVASARDIAQSRDLTLPLVAKILTELSRGGLITGSPGPGGGYRLVKPPQEISLFDVATLFEREAYMFCPFGPSWCGNNDPCPLHHSMAAIRQIESDYMRNTTFAVFVRKSAETQSGGR